ncbi:sigma factor [Lachnospiraceae bacterium JLR.KK009]
MFQYLLLLESDEDKEFFTEIYLKYRKEMFYTAYNILHNPSDAEDIVHETFLSLIDHVDKIKNSEPHKAWYYINTAVKRKCYTFYRRQHLREEVELDETWMRESS